MVEKAFIVSSGARKILGYTICVQLVLALAPVIVEPISGQDNGFLTYVNPTYGLKIHYPSNWEVIENIGDGSEYNIIVRFIPNSSNLSNFLNFDVLVDANLEEKLGDYMNKSISKDYDFMKNDNFCLIYSTIDNVTLARTPAFEYVSTSLYKNLAIGTIIGGTGYQISYTADLNSYTKYLETARKMIDSLEINPTR